jgi:hypothetical protein
VRSLMADLDPMGVYGVFCRVLGAELGLNGRDKTSHTEKYEVAGNTYDEYVFRLASFAPLKVPNNPEVTQIRMRECIRGRDGRLVQRASFRFCDAVEFVYATVSGESEEELYLNLMRLLVTPVVSWWRVVNQVVGLVEAADLNGADAEVHASRAELIALARAILDKMWAKGVKDDTLLG